MDKLELELEQQMASRCEQCRIENVRARLSEASAELTCAMGAARQLQDSPGGRSTVGELASLAHELAVLDRRLLDLRRKVELKGDSEPREPRGPEPETPELDKAKAVREKSQAIGEFLDWLLNERGFIICFRHTHVPTCSACSPGGVEKLICGMSEGRLYAEPTSIKDFLADYFEIDQKMLAAEQDAYLAWFRGQTQGKSNERE
jgi:hypothetical protein